MKPRLDRRFLAAAVLVGWIAGIAVLAQRRHDMPDSERLARGALRLEPTTYFYVVSQNGNTIGSASSAIDTIEHGFRARDIAHVRPSIAGDNRTYIISSIAYLARGFTLDSFSIALTGSPQSLRLSGRPMPHSVVLLPSLAPIALMLTRAPRMGATTQSWIYNPVARGVERVTLAIVAESLFRVADSAKMDPAHNIWIAAHTDTIRAWKIATPSHAISAWVDSQGRIVAASEAGGASVMRTAYEIATLNQKLPAH